MSEWTDWYWWWREEVHTSLPHPLPSPVVLFNPRIVCKTIHGLETHTGRWPLFSFFLFLFSQGRQTSLAYIKYIPILIHGNPTLTYCWSSMLSMNSLLQIPFHSQSLMLTDSFIPPHPSTTHTHFTLNYPDNFLRHLFFFSPSPTVTLHLAPSYPLHVLPVTYQNHHTHTGLTGPFTTTHTQNFLCKHSHHALPCSRYSHVHNSLTRKA